jgi:hypothetical protein
MQIEGCTGLANIVGLNSKESDNPPTITVLNPSAVEMTDMTAAPDFTPYLWIAAIFAVVVILGSLAAWRRQTGE